MKKRITLLIPILLVSLLQSACVSAVRPVPSKATPDSPLVVETASMSPLAKILEKLHGERLIYVGETHTRNADHLLQLSVLRSLPADNLALGLEWFQARFQPILEDFIAGRIDEAEMLRQTEYFDRWGFDYRLYRPIIQYAREHHIPIVALNASRELTNAIHDSGIKDIGPELKKELPGAYDYSDQAYDRHLREIFEQHRRGNADFERFRQVQLTWDETMAQNVADYLSAHPQRQMLVLAGRGHIAARHGIPNRVTRRTGISGAIIGSYDPGLPAQSQADYLVFNNEHPLPPRGLMGALLDIKDSRIVIKEFTPGSAAKDAGLKSGDRIVEVNGQPTQDFPRFKLLMLDKQPGDKVSVTVIRKGFFNGEERKTLEFPLKGAPGHMPKGHRGK